jgi:PAS domain S-box-containing protein
MGLVLVAVVGVTDWFTPPGMSFAMLYLVPVAFVTWFASKRAGILIAVVCAITWHWADLKLLLEAWKTFIPYWNLISRTGVLVACAFILSMVKTLNEGLETKVEQRTSDLKVSILSHQLAEEQLRQSEEKYRRLFETSRDALMTVFPPDWKFASANAATIAMFGAPDEKGFTARGPWEVSPERQPDGELSSAKAQRMMETAMAQGSHFFEWWHRRLNGEVFPATVLLTRVELEGQTGLQATVRDITEVKRTEEALRESETKFRTLFDGASDGMLVRELESRKIVMCNAACSRMLGFTPEDLLNLGILDIHPPEDVPFILEQIERFLKGEAGVRRDIRFKRRDGSTFFTDVSPTLISLGGRKSILAAFRDITERKQNEIRLATLAHAVESTSELICITDLQDRFIFANRSFQEAYGYTQAELTERTPEILFSPRPPTSLMAEINKKTRLGGWRGELLNRRKDGTEFPIRLSTSLVMERNGRVIGLIGVAQDITQRRQLEKQVVEISDREQARIGQDLHDDLCQQLVGIAFACRLLEGKLRTKSRPEAGQVGNIAHLLDEAITNAREVARGLYPVKLESEGLSSALQELAVDVSSRFDVDCAAVCVEDVTVNNIAVATHLYRIAQEAVANAVRHSQGTNIVIGLQMVDGMVTLRVSDNGIGLRTGWDRGPGMGTKIMQYRARMIDGQLKIGPGESGGTTVACVLQPGPS